MREGFVDSIKSVDGGSIKIEKRDLGIRVGQVDRSRPPCAVSHTTETSHIDLPWSNGAAHFALGPHKGKNWAVLQQTIPLGWMGTALANPPGGAETNRWCRLQVEMAGFSSLDKWLPDERTQMLFASLMEFAQQELGIPEQRAWPDELDRPPMATTSYYRRKAKWGSIAGWYKHAEVAENHHWDSGSLKLHSMLRREYLPEMVTAHQVMAIWKPDDLDHRQSDALSPHFKKKADIRKWMVKDGVLRWKMWNHLRQGHKIKIATRRVEEIKAR